MAKRLEVIDFLNTNCFSGMRFAQKLFKNQIQIIQIVFELELLFGMRFAQKLFKNLFQILQMVLHTNQLDLFGSLRSKSFKNQFKNLSIFLNAKHS